MGLHEAINWKKAKQEEDTINQLQFDKQYVEKIYDETDNTYLDFFYTDKINHSFNDYLAQIG